MKKSHLYLLIAVIVIVVGIFFGFRIAGILGIIGAGGTTLKKSKKNIDEAGEDIEAEEFDNADDAAHYVDDILSDDDSE